MRQLGQAIIQLLHWHSYKGSNLEHRRNTVNNCEQPQGDGIARATNPHSFKARNQVWTKSFLYTCWNSSLFQHLGLGVSDYCKAGLWYDSVRKPIVTQFTIVVLSLLWGHGKELIASTGAGGPCILRSFIAKQKNVGLYIWSALK